MHHLLGASRHKMHQRRISGRFGIASDASIEAENDRRRRVSLRIRCRSCRIFSDSNAREGGEPRGALLSRKRLLSGGERGACGHDVVDEQDALESGGARRAKTPRGVFKALAPAKRPLVLRACLLDQADAGKLRFCAKEACERFDVVEPPSPDGGARRGDERDALRP